MKETKLIVILLIAFLQASSQVSEHYYGTVPRSEVTLDSKVTTSGDYISVGYSFSPTSAVNTDCLIFKTDSNGSVLWTKELATINIDQFNTVIETFDGNYVAVGILNSTGPYINNTAIAIKFSAAGVIIWNKQFKNTSVGETFLDVVEMPISHDIICAGAYSFSPSINSGLLVSLNNITGNVNWAKNYDITGSNQFSGVVANGSNIFVTGIYQGITLDDGYLASINSINGNIIWSKSYEFTSILQPGINCNWFWKIQSANDKLYINGWITNDYNATGSLTSCIVELDTLGNNPVCLEMRKPGSNYSLNSSFYLSNNNFYAILHPSLVYVPISNLSDAVISKLSSLNASSSSLTYSKRISNPGEQAISSIFVLNSKLIGSGQSQNDPSQIGNIDCFHIISDTSLFSFNACAIDDTTISLANPIVSIFPFSFTNIQIINFTNPLLVLNITTPIYLNDTICLFIPPLSITASNDTICQGDLVTLTATNGSNYVWSGGVVNGIPFSPTTTATYTVTSTSASSITTTAAVTIVVNPIPLVNATVSPSVICLGDSLVFNGSGASSYSWSGGVANGLPFVPSSSGIYTVTGIDANGCSASDTVSIFVYPLNITSAIASPDSICVGQVTTLTGSGAISYSWSSGVSNGVPFIPSGTTTYTVTGIDANGCSSTNTVTVTVIPNPTVTAFASPQSICYGSSTNLTGSGALTYSWSGGIFDGISFMPTSSATYTVTGTDAIGCSNTTSISITVLPLPVVNASVNPTIICQGLPAIFTGSGAAFYFWSGGVVDGLPFYPTVTSTFTVLGTGLNGCTSTDTVSIVVLPSPTVIGYAAPAILCPNDTTTLYANGAISYTWANGSISGVPFTLPKTTTYTVTGTAANGCTGTSSVTITVNEVVVSVTTSDIDLCLGDSTQLIASGADTYLWSPNSNVSSTFSSNPFVFPTATTTYSVIGSDAIGCTGTTQITINVIPSPKLMITKSNDVECDVHSLQLSVSGGSNYTWSPAASLSSPNSAVTNATVYVPTTFYVTGTIGSCEVTDSIRVNIFNNDESAIYIPNAFTPNGDGNNDCFKIRNNANFTDYYFTIYNRWGQKVFESDDPNSCWNGSFKNDEASMGSYYYYLKGETECGKIFRKGDVLLIK